jgi:predicted permease
LKNGVTTAQAQADLRRLQGLLLPMFPWRMPDNWASDMKAVPLLEAQVGDMRPRLLLLFGAVGMILLIACANVANLVLARAAIREREMAVRGALGATAARLMRQVLSESLLLGLLSGVVGLMAATFSLQALVHILPADTPRIAEVSLHWPIVLFAAGASLVSGLLFGFIPALKMARPEIQEGLHSGSRSVAGKASQFQLSMALVVGQIGLTVVVLTGAGLMLRSLYSLLKVDPGFRTDRIVTAEVALDASACKTQGRCEAFFRTLVENARPVEGTQEVALTDSLPLSGRELNLAFDAEGHPREARQQVLLSSLRVVTPGYFPALGLRLVRGRLLNEQDESGASRAIVINERLASRLWPNQDPIGKHMMDVVKEKVPAVWSPNDAWVVVGVVANTHEDGLGAAYGDETYVPLTPASEQPMMYVLLRTRAGSAEAAAGLRRVVAQIDSLVPVTRVRTLNEVVAASVSSSRSLTILLLAFGGLALAIGGVGVYSLIAYVVSWRTREIGIRLALGAQRSQIVSGVVRQSLALAVGGSLIGLVVAALLTRFLHSFLFEVGALDPFTYCAVPVLMMLIALAGAWVPALRAASVDPILALRSE